MKTAGLVVTAVLAAVGSAGALGQPAGGYPTRLVRIVVPVAAGGTVDIIARTLAQRLTESLGQQVIVENRPSASSLVGTQWVAKSAPDGYTLLETSTTFLSAPAIVPQPGYDPVKDFAGVSLTCRVPMVLEVNPNLPVRSVKELIAYAKSKPGALNYGSAGNGSVAHLAAEQFKALAGVEIVHVPYKGSIPALNDLLAGQTQVQFENLPIVLPHIRSGKLRALAAGTKQRSALVPELPTMIEAGVPGYEASTAFGILAPARTAPAIVARLNREITQILALPDVKERLSSMGLEPAGGPPARYAEHMRAELAQNAKVVKAAGIKIE